MPIKVEKDDGVEIDAYTPEELEAQKQAAVEAAKAEALKEIAEKEAEIERLKKVSAEKTENFKKYNDLTEEEKKRFDENTVILMRRLDQVQEELTTTKSALNEKESKEKEYQKTSALKQFYGESEEVRQKIETSYGYLSGMPEGTPEEINAKALAAARLAGIDIDERNPLYVSINGESPKYKENKDFTDTPEGKAAEEAVRQRLAEAGLLANKKD